jgi:AraC-like DNA-binding protein
MHELHIADKADSKSPDEAAFIQPDKISVTHFAPPASLAPFVTQIYTFRCTEQFIRGMQPAALGQMLFVMRGAGTVQFAGSAPQMVPKVHFYGPCTAASEFNFTGPLHHYGIAFSPLGFVALTGRSAKNCADKICDASEVFGDDIVALNTVLSDATAKGEMRPAQIVQMITDFLLPFARKISSSDINLIQSTIGWLSSTLNPDIEDIYSQLSMSRGTATRLIGKYFGASPKFLARKYRAVRAATYLTDPNCDAKMRDQVESIFYDQPHMIREIRHFTGSTPGALDSDAAKILRIWLSKENYRDLESHPG